jgi:hypothetical protein
VTFANVHVGSVNSGCAYSEILNSELGPSIDNNSKFVTEANPVLIEGNRVHHYDRSNVNQHMECFYFSGTVNLTLRRNVFGPCAIMAIHAKEYPPFINNRLENNIFLPGAEGVEYRYAPCSNLVVRYNVIADGLYDSGCSSTVTGNIIFDDGSSPCPGWSYNIFIGDPCGPNSFSSTLAALFVNAGQQNYHLRAGSPAINAGNPTNYPPDDLDGELRPFGPRADVGAYEDG